MKPHSPPSILRLSMLVVYHYQPCANWCIGLVMLMHQVRLVRRRPIWLVQCIAPDVELCMLKARLHPMQVAERRALRMGT